MGPEDARTDEALLAATATDPQAFAVFYRRHLRAVLAFLVHPPTSARWSRRPSATRSSPSTDGDFVSGSLRLTAHLQGGGTWTQECPLGF
ncbi:hypothetical protein DVA67_019525 [Solirubrobacter sp. CPCC 204708]|uniref:RNA polymerase sigma-70 region 2 domain-containing protein n=1 Tax=Solirubrobacter deserti TaxID=2282478 RepID=A0ABT4RG02_9ACTN|nr:hypothetical protein [Solirubrobacter deserti]MBE2318181.1 hypothetical protein [Solirubrobacter deserti]MDA0137462.1 hypothetical protein [Solirubrobacter deserti]